MSDFDDLEAAVAAETEIDEAAVALLDGLAERIEGLVDNPDPSALQTLAQQVRANSAKLSAAITANTSAVAPSDDALAGASTTTAATPAPASTDPAPTDSTTTS